MKKNLIISTLLALSLLPYALGENISNEDIQRFSAYYSNGMQYLKNNQYASAIIEFKKVLRFSPYDTTIKDALQNAYFARAQYYLKTTKENEKALNDFKSAVFYAKYWKQGTLSQASMALISDAEREINALNKRLSTSTNADNILKQAKILRAQGELAAAGYDFQTLLVKGTTAHKEDAYQNLGNIYKNLNNISMAMDYMKMAIEINPKNPKLHFLYGVMLDDAKNYEASLEQYNLALQYGENSPELLEILENKWMQNIVNNPNDAQSYINLGAIYQKQGNFEGAKMQYLKAYQMDSKDNTSLYNLASLYIAQKNYQGAIDTYNKMLLKEPNDIELINYKADILKKMSKYEDAIKEYEKILALDSGNKKAKEEIDNIVLNQFTGAKLLAYLKQKAIQNPNNYEAQFNYALELHKNKNYQSALEYYKKALSLDSSKEETYINLASIYIEQKDFQAAGDICQKGLLVMPNNAQLNNYIKDIEKYSVASIYDKAAQYYNNGQYKAALEEYLKIKDKDNSAKMMIAACYFELKDFNNANKYYLEILNTEPNNKEAILNSAWAYYSLNDTNNAKLKVQNLLNIEPTNANAKELLAQINQLENSKILNDGISFYEKNDFNSALNVFNKYLNQNPNDIYAMYYKALCLDELKKPNDAIKQYKAIIAKDVNYADAYYSLALALDNMENYKEAIYYYEKYIALKGNTIDEQTKFVKSRLAELKDYIGKLNAQK